MTPNARRSFLKLGLGVACACAGAGVAFAQVPAPGQKYVCPPCGCSADDKEFDAPGVCPACGQLKPYQIPRRTGACLDCTPEVTR